MNTIVTLFLLGAAFTGDDKAKSDYEHPIELNSDRAVSLDTSAGALIHDVMIHSAVSEPFLGDVLVRDGRIESIGQDLVAPQGVVSIDGTGKHLAPGVIDTHSHMAIERGINEGSLSITADCDITDVINSDDKTIYRALAGGVTTIQCLHGSANAIGGRSEVLKLKWNATVDEMRFPGAPQGIKFALGENPKQSNWGPGGRYPATRMGVESVFQRAFRRAGEYRSMWADYEAAKSRGEDPAPPRRDVRLDVLVGILSGEVNVHSHCYRADEILMLLRTAESFGFRIKTLQHVLEGYKIAAEIAAHGAGTSTFSDWWGYKIEAYDAIPQNAALLDEAGALSTINSDSAELVRHLYHEAAKSVRYADMEPTKALRLATLNGALQLGVGDRVGSIEEGKDADLVLLNADPLSTYCRVVWTMVDGVVQFQRRDAFGLDAQPAALRSIRDVAAVEASYSPDAGPVIAIVGGTLHPVASPDIENGTLLVQAGRIIEMGRTVSVPEGALLMDASGQHVWPGLISLNTQVGIAEIDSIKATQDQSEIGGNQPDLSVTRSVNADSAYIDVARSNGITRNQTVPAGRGPIQGQSAVIRLHGDTWEEMLTLGNDMLHLRFPRVSNSAEKKEEPKSLKPLKEYLEEAREYARMQSEAQQAGLELPPFRSRLEALAPFAMGEKRVAVHVGNAQAILYALRFIKDQELDAVLYGVEEGWKVAEAIAEAGVPCVIGSVQTTVGSGYDPYDAAYANAALLHRAGVEFAISTSDTANARNLPFHAGFAAAYGLPYEEALRAITYYPAKILGLEEQLGSLMPGKLADVVITDGDIMEAMTQVTAILIEGEPVDIGNRQTRLYDYYHERLHRLESK